MSRVLVTGANGFVGSHLVPALSTAGMQVQGVVRRLTAQQPQLSLRRVWSSLGLIADDLSGIDTIFHLAGLAHAGARGADREALFNVNVDQTVNLYRQAVAAGVPRFVWLSSIKVLGDASECPLAVDAPYRPGDDYAASKVAAERLLLAEPAGSTRLCIVRPPLVYGVGVKANFRSLLRVALSSTPLPLASATAPRAWLGMHNLVDFLLTLARTPALPDQSIWHLRDAEETSVHDMVDLIAAQAGNELRQWRFNPTLAINLARLVGRGDVAARLFLPLQVDMSATEQALSWRPVRSQRDQIGEVVRWYQTL